MLAENNAGWDGKQKLEIDGSGEFSRHKTSPIKQENSVASVVKKPCAVFAKRKISAIFTTPGLGSCPPSLGPVACESAARSAAHQRQLHQVARVVFFQPDIIGIIVGRRLALVINQLARQIIQEIKIRAGRR